MICVKEVGSDTFECNIASVFFLGLRELSHSVHLRQVAHKLYVPLSIGNSFKNLMLRTHQALTKKHLADRELPLLREFVPDQEVYPVFTSVVKGPHIGTMRVYLGVIFRRCTVLMHLTCLRVCILVSRVVIHIHFTDVRVPSVDALVKLNDFGKLFEMLSVVTVVFVHGSTAQLDHLDVWFAHVHKYWCARDHQTDIDTEHVPREDIERRRVEIDFSIELFLHFVDFLRRSLEIL